MVTLSYPSKRNPGVPVIKHESGIRQVVVCGELLQDSLLILDAARDTLFFIVTGQSGIENSNSLFIWLLFLQNILLSSAGCDMNCEVLLSYHIRRKTSTLYSVIFWLRMRFTFPSVVSVALLLKWALTV